MAPTMPDAKLDPQPGRFPAQSPWLSGFAGLYFGATPALCPGESQRRPQGAGLIAGGLAMIIHQYVSKAVQDDAPRAGERDRLLLETRRARTPRPKRPVSAAPARRLARLLLRRAPA